MIRRRDVSCREVVAAALARLDAVNPRINAVVRPLHETALAEAAAADQALARGAVVGPLHGVPITTKVNVDQTGCPTDNGVVAFKDLVATRDNPVVANLRRAGAIVIGRTNTPAFSMRWFTDNALHGATLNPWDPARTPGGSSGGAAAATATGIGAIGHGNDIAGSVRYPAYCCGLVGLRVSYGRVPSWNFTSTVLRTISSQLMAVQGPLTRRVRDARAAFAAMAIPDPNDPRCATVPLDGPPVAAPAAGRAGGGPRPPRRRRARGGVLGASGRPLARGGGIRGGGSGAARARRGGRSLGRHRDGGRDRGAGARRRQVRGRGNQAKRSGSGGPSIRPASCGMCSTGWPSATGSSGCGSCSWRSGRSWSPRAPTSRRSRSISTGSTSTRPGGSCAPRSCSWRYRCWGCPRSRCPPAWPTACRSGVQITAGRFREDLCLDAAAAIEARAPMATPIDPR